MTTKRLMALGILLAVLASLASASVWAGTEGPEAGPQAPLSPLGARFTYQGRLTHNDGPVNDLCDFQFGLYDAGSSVTPIDMQTLYDVEVTGGFFTVHVDFGPTPFRGEERWLGIAVRCPAGSGTYTPFSERQLLTATPYALYAAASEWDGIAGIPPDFGDGVDNDTLYFPGDGLDLALDNSFSLLPSFRLPQSCGDGMVTKWESAISRWVCGDDNVGVGAEAWLLTGNAGTEHGLHRLGTTDSVSLTLVVDSAPALRLEFTGQAANLVGGDPVNEVTPGVWGATVGGGGGPSEPNRVTDKYGTVGGGSGNQAGDGDGLAQNVPWATVGGGRANIASGGFATVGGGYHNLARGNYATIAGGGPSDIGYPDTTNNRATDSYGTIGGGGNNQVGNGDGDVTNARYATIGGGWGNIASGVDATVGGGYGNEASGDEAAIGGGVGNDAAGYAAAVGGGLGNQATADFATIAGGGRADVTDFYTANRVTDKYGTIGGGADNQAGDNRGSPSDATFATIGGGLSNTANSTAATVGGGYTNTITGTAATISGGEGNTAGASYVTIGGGADNEISVSPFNFFPEYATIAGGGENSVVGWGGNMLSWGYGATIGGGTNNTAGQSYATIGGGYDNTVNGDSSTIGGGVGNTIYGDSWYSTIGGGEENTIQRSIHHATIPGGLWNVAGGHYSFAAGFRAKANHEGSFVWGDSTIADFASERDDQFRVRASGGARFDVNNSGWANIYAQTAHATTVLIDTSTGAYLTAGGSWTNSSDRNAKENSALVNGRGVLARLAQLPISTWNYKAEDRSVRHMGPMAQDFFAAFGLGSDDKAIGTLDADGVALAAIQGLFEVVEEKDTEMAAMQTEIATLHRQNSDLEARVAALEQQTAGRHSPVSLGWLLSGCALAAVVVVGRRFAGDGP